VKIKMREILQTELVSGNNPSQYSCVFY